MSVERGVLAGLGLELKLLSLELNGGMKIMDEAQSYDDESQS